MAVIPLPTSHRTSLTHDGESRWHRASVTSLGALSVSIPHSSRSCLAELHAEDVHIVGRVDEPDLVPLDQPRLHAGALGRTSLPKTDGGSNRFISCGMEMKVVPSRVF